ncbi:MAG: PQQ-like beta-propeller repeat protein [Ignavibacteriales bacterium]|nr:PQQ-like beta-propeller repeat protein [Ignavibacteriales bacterium]
MRKIRLLFFVFSILFVAGCKDEITKPSQKGNPPGYQVDIAWPSLSKSSWPVYHADPQNTGRVKTGSTVSGYLYKNIPALNMECGIITGNDSMFFFTSGPNHCIVAMKYNGDTLWKSPLAAGLSSTPVACADGSIIYALGKTVTKLDKTGNMVWTYPLPLVKSASSLTIDKNGNIYLIDYTGTLYCLSSSGALLWSRYESSYSNSIANTFSFSTDGNTLYIAGSKKMVHAIDIRNNMEKWSFGDGLLRNAPLIDSDDNLFIIAPPNFQADSLYVYSINKEGQIRWKVKINTTYDLWDCNATIDRNGNIYFGMDTVYSYTNAGQALTEHGLLLYPFFRGTSVYMIK